MNHPKIPRFFRALINLVVPHELRDTVVGDLEEEFCEHRVPLLGLSKASNWYRRECLSIALSFSKERINQRREISTSRRIRPEMTSIFNDIKFGYRALIKQPVSAIMSVLILSVGIGLSTTMFTIMYGVFMRGLDFPEADRLTLIFETNISEDVRKQNVPIHDFFEWREGQHSFEGLFAWYTGTFNVSGTGEAPERYSGTYVTANTFGLLRATPFMGRTFQPGEDSPGAPPVAIVGYDVWNGHFNGAEDIIGRTMRINGNTATIVGVMEEEFGFPSGQSIWIPMQTTPSDVGRGDRHVRVMGRLADGVALEQAEFDIASIARGLERQYPETNEGVGVSFMTFSQDATPIDEFGSVFVVMMAAGLLVLLVACANVANILLSKAAMRTKEAAIRTAMGASRFRVILPFFAESLVLAGVAAVLGTAIAYGAVGAFDAATADLRPFFIEFVVDGPILLYVLGVAALTSLAAGAFPAIQVAKADVNLVLKDESRGTSSLRMGRISKMLVIGEVALSCLLLVGAGIMAKSMKSVGDVNFAFDPEQLFTARIVLPEQGYGRSEQVAEFAMDLTTRLTAHPQIASVTLSASIPGLGGNTTAIRLDGESYEDEGDLRTAARRIVSPTFFETLGIAPTMGRNFETHEGPGQPAVAIVGRNFADRFFPGINPVGERFHEGSEEDGEWVTVVGIAPEIGLENLTQVFGDSSSYYVSSVQNELRSLFITARASAGNPMALAGVIRETVHLIDEDLPIFSENLLTDALNRFAFFFNIFGTFFVVFGVVTLTMAMVGLYGVLSFSVTSRIPELGVRIALGAASAEIVRLILRQGGGQIAIGMVLGLAAALGVTQFMGMFLFDVNPHDPLVFGAVSVVVAAVGVLAMLVPARRASRVDPMVALRSE